MRLITRCPACGTLFKVVPDQLRISDGWVRCGHCAEVFDADEHLQRDESGPEAAPVLTAPAPLTPAKAGRAPPDSEAFTSSLNTDGHESMGFDAPDSAQIEAEAAALVEDPLDRPFELRLRDASEAGESRSRDDDSKLDSELEDSRAGHEPSFLRDSERQPFWAQRGVRATLIVSAVVLAVLFALQVAAHDRDRVAAAVPALRPLLVRLCEPLKCVIGPPRQIDAVAIDSSSFNKLRGDAYRLNVTLKNQAGIAIAMPALELTLTDAQDKAVVRRVLMPAEIGSGAGVIAAASDWSGSLALAVSPNGGGARIAGYRLLAFYP